MNDEQLWKTKLAARLHDPAEKALVLLRDPAGHENGTSKSLMRLLGLSEVSAEELSESDPDNADVLAHVIFKDGLPLDMYQTIRRADWWAAAADRPQWPMERITHTTPKGEQKTFAVAEWARVRWTQEPVLVHPLTGAKINLHSLNDTDIGDIKKRSFDHFSNILNKLDGQDASARDLRKILLAFWRFGPELGEDDDNGALAQLWPLLPADTRVPDHSIWDHLDLTSAFAGAFAADRQGEAALLALSIGPVQGFIAAARSASDLWAGSHLLSRLAWEAMRPICEQLGPDAILFPRLRGIPQVDVWLRDEMGLPEDLFSRCSWNTGNTDANPLFSAALPNRLVAVVPASQAGAIAEQITQSVRTWLRQLGQTVVERLLQTAGLATDTRTPYEQMEQQIAGFPEVHWAAVPFSLIAPRNQARQTDLDVSSLLGAMAPFFGVEPGKPCGFLDTPAWKALGKELDWGDNTAFFAPNPGVLYPAVFDLAERVAAAAKATRSFDQSEQTGWRCALTGEAEWLTTDRAQLAKSYRQQTDTLWARIAQAKPSWAKKGEHLSALPAIKRLWPTIFAEAAGQAVMRGKTNPQKSIDRFVVSTHTMALAHQLDLWLEKGGLTPGGFAEATAHTESVALPRRLMRRHAQNPALADAKRIPSLLEAAREQADDDSLAFKDAERLVRQALTIDDGAQTGRQGSSIRLETYYALLMMDGDKMGAILSGDEKTHCSISYRASFHPKVGKGFDERAAKQALIKHYGEQKRAISPNRHLAISGALNDFSQIVVRHVVEEEHLGRVIYAGGDDVLAMLPVADMLPAMQRLRHAYSGTLPEDADLDWGKVRAERKTLHCKNGFAMLNGRLMRMMGEYATASTGAVIAHHQAPLSAVLRELRAAEKRAKTEGGRDAFSITIIKRSGGALYLTAAWGEPLQLLADLRNFLAHQDTSRRAVYHTLEWLKDLPSPRGAPEMLESMLAYQLNRQAHGSARDQAPSLAKKLAALAAQQERDGLKWLENFLTVAEFLARETRAGGDV